LEIWYDWLGFVPRYRLGEIVPEIGDRRFASIVQKFLHEYREITINDIEIVAPSCFYPEGPHVETWHAISKLAEAQMPANITNFKDLDLRFAHPFFCFTNYLIWEVKSHNSPHTDICGMRRRCGFSI
jgi:hypothetical protein